MKTQNLNWKKSTVLYVTGYVIAVLASVAVVTILITLPTALPDDGRFGSFFRQMEILPAIFLVGIMYTGISALPGYVVSLITAHRLNIHGLRFYLAAGVLTAVLAHILFGVFAGFFLVREEYIFLASLPGGAVGASAYFLWREKMLSVWVR